MEKVNQFHIGQKVKIKQHVLEFMINNINNKKNKQLYIDDFSSVLTVKEIFEDNACGFDYSFKTSSGVIRFYILYSSLEPYENSSTPIK